MLWYGDDILPLTSVTQFRKEMVDKVYFLKKQNKIKTCPEKDNGKGVKNNAQTGKNNRINLVGMYL